jgi:hypothetical protein
VEGGQTETKAYESKFKASSFKPATEDVQVEAPIDGEPVMDDADGEPLDSGDMGGVPMDVDPHDGDPLDREPLDPEPLRDKDLDGEPMDEDVCGAQIISD